MNRRSLLTIAVIAAVLLPASFLISVSVGSSGGFRWPYSGGPDNEVLLNVRAPRAMAAAVVGAALSTAGAALQAILLNPLAEPFILGVSGGAALGGTAAILLGLTLSTGAPWVVIFAAAAAALTTLLLSAVSRTGGRTPIIGILLTGVIFNAFASAIITFLKFMVPVQKTWHLTFWLSGMLGYETPATLIMVGLFVLTATIALAFLSHRMNVLTLGDQSAQTLGVDPSRTRLYVFSLASLLTGAAVALSGLVGFVGLIVPQGLRFAGSPDNRFLIPASALAGAVFLMLSDTLCRFLSGVVGSEPPLGAITAIIGGPVFFVLLKRHLKGVNG